jgi:hypothetical protein
MFIIDKVLTMLLLPTALMVECALLGLSKVPLELFDMLERFQFQLRQFVCALHFNPDRVGPRR